jgi:hypothetical protein
VEDIMRRAALLALAFGAAGVGAPAAHAASPIGLPARSANASAQVAEAASQRCWRRNGKRVCERAGRSGTPAASEPYFDFAPNAVPTARRGWRLDDPVNHPVPSPN